MKASLRLFLLSVALTGLVLLALLGFQIIHPAQVDAAGSTIQHTVSISNTCDTLHISLTNYNGTNTIVIQIQDGVQINTTFGSSFVNNYPIPPHYPSTSVHVKVTAHDDPNNLNGYSPTYDRNVVPCNTATPTQTPTASPTSTATATPSDTPTNTATSTNTNTPTLTPSNTPTDTATNTPTDTATFTLTPSETPTDTFTPTDTPTNTLTPSDTPTGTLPPTDTPTNTSTATNTPIFSPTPSDTSSPTLTPSLTDTPNPDATPTLSPTPTNTTDPRTLTPPPTEPRIPKTSNATCVYISGIIIPDGIYGAAWDDGSSMDGYVEVQNKNGGTQVAIFLHFPDNQAAPSGTIHFLGITVVIDWSQSPPCQEQMPQPTPTVPPACTACGPHIDENLKQDKSGAWSMQADMQDGINGGWHRLIVSDQPFSVNCPSGVTMVDQKNGAGYYLFYGDQNCFPSRAMISYGPCSLSPDPVHTYWYDKGNGKILLFPGQALSEIQAALSGLGLNAHSADGLYRGYGWVKLKT